MTPATIDDPAILGDIGTALQRSSTGGGTSQKLLGGM